MQLRDNTAHLHLLPNTRACLLLHKPVNVIVVHSDSNAVRLQQRHRHRKLLGPYIYSTSPIVPNCFQLHPLLQTHPTHGEHSGRPHHVRQPQWDPEQLGTTMSAYTIRIPNLKTREGKANCAFQFRDMICPRCTQTHVPPTLPR